MKPIAALKMRTATIPAVTSPGTAYRYYGVRVLTTGNGFVGCSQLSLFESGSATDRALAGTAGTVFTQNGSFPASNVNDGNAATFTTSSSSAAAGSNGIIYIDFGSGNAYAIAKLGYRARPATSNTTESPLTWEIVAKQNSGDAWTTIATLAEQTVWGDNEYREVTFTELSYPQPLDVSTLGNNSVSAVYAGPSSPTYAVTSGSLPPGISLNSSTGALTGTASSAGTYSSIVITATAGGFATASPAFTITSVAGYKYYFLEVVTTGNTFIGCSTLKLLDAGSTDWALQSNGGVASAVAYTVNGSFPINLVNDGNDTSFTTSNTGSAGSGHGILITLKRMKDIDVVGFRSRSDAFGANEAITSGFVKAKINVGDSYTSLYTITESGWSNNEYRTWTMP